MRMTKAQVRRLIQLMRIIMTFKDKDIKSITPDEILIKTGECLLLNSSSFDPEIKEYLKSHNVNDWGLV